MNRKKTYNHLSEKIKSEFPEIIINDELDDVRGIWSSTEENGLFDLKSLSWDLDEKNYVNGVRKDLDYFLQKNNLMVEFFGDACEYYSPVLISFLK